MFFEPRLDAFAEERTIGQDHGGTSIGLEDADDECQKEIGSFTGLEVLRKVAFDAVLLTPAKGWISEDDLNTIRLRVADIGPGQRVVVAHEAGVLYAMQQHVGDAEHVRQLLLLHRMQRDLHVDLVFDPLHIMLAHVANGAGEESAGAACGIEQRLAGMGINAIDHEGGDRARRVVFAGVAGALQVGEDLLVDIAEVLALDEVVEIDLVDLVDDLAQQLARLHVVVGVLEDIANDATAIALLASDGKVFELGKEFVVDEGEQPFAGDAFWIGGPRAPAQIGRDGRAIAGLQHFKLLVLVIDDFEEEHPAELGDALGVAINAGVLAHDVLNGFNGIANRHIVAYAL